MAAKNELVAAINRHCKQLRKAVEDDHAKPEKSEHWGLVESALKAKEAVATKAAEVESAAKAQLAELRASLDKAKKDRNTKDSALLINAEETLRQLEYRIEDGIAAVKAAAIESKIVAEFKELVQKGREEFSRELCSILPNVQPGTEGKLTEEELNALIAHAHLRVRLPSSHIAFPSQLRHLIDRWTSSANS